MAHTKHITKQSWTKLQCIDNKKALPPNLIITRPLPISHPTPQLTHPQPNLRILNSINTLVTNYLQKVATLGSQVDLADNIKY